MSKTTWASFEGTRNGFAGSLRGGAALVCVLLIIPIQPARCRRGNILDGVANPFRNEHFVTRFRDDLFSTDGELELPIHYGHEFVHPVDEIIPLASRRVGKYIAGIATPAPVLRDLVAIERWEEFVAGEIGHGEKL